MGGIGSGRKPHGLDHRTPKRCARCHQEFERSLDNFNWHDYAWDNLQPYCRTCQSEYSRRWWYEHHTLPRINKAT